MSNEVELEIVQKGKKNTVLLNGVDVSNCVQDIALQMVGREHAMARIAFAPVKVKIKTATLISGFIRGSVPPGTMIQTIGGEEEAVALDRVTLVKGKPNQ